MFNIVLYEPEIPPNTGNIVRLCVNLNARLHLIHPLGFELNDAQMRRAGLDYRHQAVINEHGSFNAFLDTESPEVLYALSTRGRRFYSEVSYQAGDYIMLGPETRGLPGSILESSCLTQVLRIPMSPQPDNRSLNVNNAAAIVAYEAWRQLGFAGGA